MTNRRIERVQPAVRRSMKARLMIAGPAGAGKTHTALTIARALCPDEMPLVIDTEEESALTYADKFAFHHLPWDPPFNPQELAQVVTEVAPNYPCVIIDSASHFWSDDGGTLDVAGGKFTGWKTARPMQRDLIVSVLRAPTNMIVCVRSKMEHAQETDAKTGKHVVTKLGMAPVQDSTFEYEVNVSAELDMTHTLSISKTRCDLLDGREFPAGHSTDMALIYSKWLEGGEPVAAPEDVTGLVTRMNDVIDEALRKSVKQEFVQRFGRPEHLLASKVAEADLFLFSALNPPDPDPEGLEDTA